MKSIFKYLLATTFAVFLSSSVYAKTDEVPFPVIIEDE